MAKPNKTENEAKEGVHGSESLLPPHGGYRKLKSFKIAQLAFDVTVRFANRYIDRSSRTHDQMVQAARSGVQNIGEGSEVSGTSKKMKPTYAEVAANAAHVLVGVACALLDRQIESLAAAFEREGGFTERLYRVRSARRR